MHDNSNAPLTNTTPELNGGNNNLFQLCAVGLAVGLLTFGATKYFESQPKEALNQIVAKKTDHTNSLKKFGFKIIKKFDVRDNITGYALTHSGQPITAYGVAGSDLLMIGDLVTQDGINLSEVHRNDYINANIAEAGWSLLQDASYIVDQDVTDAPVLYTVTDPNCPYCLKLWENTRELVEGKNVEIRHVVVGILGEDSRNKAAALLGAENPVELMDAYLTGKSQGEEIDLPKGSEDAYAQVEKNNSLMREAGISGTPTSFIKMPDGSVEMLNGAVPAERIQELLEKF